MSIDYNGTIYLTIKEASERSHIAEQTLRNATTNGRLRAYTFPSHATRLFVIQEDVDGLGGAGGEPTPVPFARERKAEQPDDSSTTPEPSTAPESSTVPEPNGVAHQTVPAAPPA